MQKFPIALVALTAALCWGPSPAAASDAALDQGTIILISTDNYSQCQSSMGQSGFGSFLNDPEIKAISGRLKDGISGLLKSFMGEPGSPEAAVANATTSYLSAVMNDTTGRMSFSFGIYNDEAGPQPQILFHVQGKPSIGAAQLALIDAAGKLGTEAMKRTSFTVGGVKFDGYDIDGVPSLMRSPDGVYFGQKDDHFFMGMSKSGLTAYVNSLGESKTIAADRLGADAFYKSSKASIGGGNMSVFVNTKPIFQILQMFMGHEQEMLTLVRALGIFDLGGMAQSYHMSKAGTEGRALVGLSGRTGILKLVPESNAPQTFPKYIGKHSIQAYAGRLELKKGLDIVYGVADAFGEEVGARAEVDAFLAEFKGETGLDMKSLVAALEGTYFFSTGPAPPDPNAMMPSLGGGEMVLGLKLTDPAAITEALKVAMKSPELEGSVKAVTHLGRQLMVVGGGTSEDDLYAAPTPEFALTVDGNWLLAGTPGELRKALAVHDGPAGGHLAADPRVAAGLAKVGTNGMMLSYTNTSELICGTLDMIRPMIGLLPFLLGDSPELMPLADPGNVPSNAVIKKYFGIAIGNARTTKGGIELISLSPSVKAAAAPKKKEEEAKPKKEEPEEL